MEYHNITNFCGLVLCKVYKRNTDGIQTGRSIGIEIRNGGRSRFWCYHLTYYVGRKFKNSRPGSARKNQSTFRLRQEKIEDDPAPGENLPPRPTPYGEKRSSIMSPRSITSSSITSIPKFANVRAVLCPSEILYNSRGSPRSTPTFAVSVFVYLA